MTLLEILLKVQNPTTKRKMTYWARNLKSFATASNIGDLESLDKEGVNKLLCLFVIQLKKADGSEYELHAFHSSVIGRYVTDIGKGDVKKDVKYQGLRDVKKAKLKLIKSAGKFNRPISTSPTARTSTYPTAKQDGRWEMVCRRKYKIAG